METSFHLLLLAGVGFIAWRAGFAAGARSVPLDGAGLASGDDRAFDDRHYWNPNLGAWERRS